MCIIFYQENTDRSYDKKANWTEFNKFLYKDNVKPASIVGQTPLLDAKVNRHDTVNTVIGRVKFIAEKMGEDHVWITTDQDVLAPSEETKWTHGEEWGDVYFRLGGLQNANMYNW